MASNEDSKNMALLFFMDHLMQKNGCRTIHDLSCQFGARGFTPEMREAVGGTQEGLSDFLCQFPSLFKLEGDTISINSYGDLAVGGAKASPLLQNLSSRDRDYAKEAVEFFEAKLKKFGPELQIKSLLGHRSQAAPEVRLVSGRHVKDFTDFLAQHREHFIVDGDRVRLTQMPEPMHQRADLDENGVLLAGAKAKQAAVDFMKDVLEQQVGVPLPMDALYEEFCSRFSHSVRQEVATNPKELLSFLKLNRTIFFIRSNKVSLVKNRGEGSEDGETPLSVEGDLEERNGTVLSEPATEEIVVVKSLKPAQQAVQELVADGMQSESAVVAVDFKLVSLGSQTPDFVALVVVGTPSGSVYVFDVAHSDSILLESGLKDLLTSADWIKVIHECKRVSAILYQQYGILLESVFDTQVANAVVQHQKTGKPLHEIRAISFLHLQRVYFPESLMLSDVNPRKTHKPDSQFWSVRPLTDEMIKIAVEEVGVMPSIYQIMKSALKPELLSTLEQLCAEQVNFFIQYDEVKQRRQERKQRVAMDVINGKLSRDPTGWSLTNREKRILDRAEGDPHGCDCLCHLALHDAATQTLSTGEITMSNIYYETS